MKRTQEKEKMRDRLFLFSALTASILFISGYWSVFHLLVSKWMESDEYSHAFIVLPILLYMIWKQRELIAAVNVRYSFIGLILVLVSTLCFMFSLLTQVHTLIILSMLITVVGSIIYLRGIEAVKKLIIPLLLLLLLVPVPDQLYIYITSPLQIKVSQISELFIGGIGVPILRDGNIMTVPEKSFEVVEACSGMRSLISLLTLSIIMGYFLLEKGISKAALAAASVPTAIFINIVRVTAMILMFHFFGLNLTEGTPHTLLGLVTFGLAFATLFALYKVLGIWERR